MKKISIFLISLVLMCGTTFPALAEVYGNNYPDYVPISGGAYIEAQSSLGTVTFVFQNQYKSGYFGFVGSSGYNVCNVYGGTISGTVYLSNGQSYSVRSSYGEPLEYRSNTYPYDYNSITVTQILNTNVEFIDLQSDRENIIPDFSPFQIIVTCLLLFLLLLKIHNHTKIG